MLHNWKIPGDFYHGHLIIGLSNSYQYNLENMKEYDIDS